VANPEHLAVLRQGAAIWNEWRASSPNSRPDLVEANLRAADLGRANLSGANLGRANLSAAKLSWVDLRDADLSRVTLFEADLQNADLSSAKLIEANLSRANLGGADLTAVNLFRANLSGIALSGADLRLANFSEANLCEADLSEARLSGTIIGDVDLTRTRGLDRCDHWGPSVVDFRTLSQSGNLPINFLRGCGLPDTLIEYLPSLTGAAIRFYSCFISYSAKDKVFAERLHADLQNEGVRCWFAPHDLPWGAKTWDTIDEAIRVREKLLLILSKASIASEWVEDEVNKAYAEERSRKKTVLFPIRIDNEVMSTAEPWAVKLREQRNIGDFRQWRKPAEYKNSLERLLRDLKASGMA